MHNNNSGEKKKSSRRRVSCKSVDLPGAGPLFHSRVVSGRRHRGRITYYNIYTRQRQESSLPLNNNNEKADHVDPNIGIIECRRTGSIITVTDLFSSAPATIYCLFPPLFSLHRQHTPAPTLAHLLHCVYFTQSIFFFFLLPFIWWPSRYYTRIYIIL